MNSFDTAIDNLVTDIADEQLTLNQVIHTAACISEAYGPPAVTIMELAVADARMRQWTPPCP